MANDRFKIMRHCAVTRDALMTAVWDATKLTADVRLDNGTTNIDVLDAQEYATERHMTELMEYRAPRRDDIIRWGL